MIWDPAHPTICQDKEGRAYLLPSRSKFRPRPTTSFATTAVGSSTSPAIGLCRERRAGAWASSPPTSTATTASTSSWPTTAPSITSFAIRADFTSRRSVIQAGVGAGVQGGYQAGMGVACGDLDGDGRPDLMVTNFYGEGTTLFQNLGRRPIHRPQRGLRNRAGDAIPARLRHRHGRRDQSWPARCHDHQRSCRRQSAFLPVRHAQPAVRKSAGRPARRYLRARRVRAGRWNAIGRGLAAGDLDNDGRVDALIVAQNEPLAYFHNRTKRVGSFRDVPARGDEVEPRWRGSERHGHTPEGGARSPSAPAVAAISRLTIHGFTSAWATRLVSNQSKFTGRRDGSIAGPICVGTRRICCGKAHQEFCVFPVSPSRRKAERAFSGATLKKWRAGKRNGRAFVSEFSRQTLSRELVDEQLPILEDNSV